MKTKYKFGDFAPKKRFSVTSHFKFQSFFVKCLISDILWLIFVLEVVVVKRSSSGSCGTEPYILWRSDGRCGQNFPVFRSTLPSECDPRSDRPCCSDYGYCGNSPSHCQCSACVDYRLTPQNISCLYILEDRTGYLLSPNYPRSYPLGQDCCYDIRRPGPQYCGVSLLVEKLDVGLEEENGYCQRDWLSVPSCVPEKGTRICGNQSGQYYQYLFQPGASAIRIEFHAGDMNFNKRGFKIKYNLLRRCQGPFQTQSPPISSIPGTRGTPCYTRIIDQRGTINTPFFPDPYPGPLDCIYEFIRTDYKICGIKMDSYRFNMEPPITTPFGGACKDFFHLPSCGFVCGEVRFSWIVKFQPGATSLKFHFHSNGNNSLPTDNGFLINFEQVIEC